MSKVDEKAFEAAKQAFIEYRKVSDHPLYCLQAGIEAYLAAKVPEQPVECASFDDNALEAAHDVAARHGIKKFVAARIVEAYIDILPKREIVADDDLIDALLNEHDMDVPDDLLAAPEHPHFKAHRNGVKAMVHFLNKHGYTKP